MAPANLFHFLTARQRGQARGRLQGTQLKLLRLRERWCLPHAAPTGSEHVKDIVPLGDDAFCMVFKGGRADAFAAAPGTVGAPQWLTGLSVFHGERVRMVAHVCASGALLTVFAVPGAAYRGHLFARVLEVSAILAGETRTLNSGTLADISVPAGGFIEFDDQNQCIWASDCQRLRCWDACSFEERFALGPWEQQDVPNVRFTRGLAGLLRPGQNGAIEVGMHDVKDGRLLALTEVQLPPPETCFVFLEMVNECVIMKRQSCDVVVVSLKSSASRVLPGTSAWEPDAFVFLPSQKIILALFSRSLEIWSCSSPEFFCRLGRISQVDGITENRFSVDEGLGAALVVRQRAARPGSTPPQGHSEEELALLDLLRFGGARAAVRGACEAGGGGVGRVLFDAARGLLLLLGRGGGLTAYTSG